ncbi:GNAT family N-acetyltransferase [Nocardiopsis sediminis]|uniref:GNAT family N-acetyltransferase n=1 Tax=Nocardiopsis sediminis TaxID=1778267 RepID=A0ABV8FL15_9ACTN
MAVAAEQAQVREGRLRTRVATMADPGVRPMLAELTAEYADRYGPDVAAGEMRAHPDAEFAPPHGAVVLVEEDGVPVAGGAFRRLDARTAELKRVWTARAHRRRGLARRAVEALETEAARRGYTRVHLTTGPSQPAAVALYLALGYALSGSEGVDASGRRLYYAFAKALPGR